jgi:threonine synthase
MLRWVDLVSPSQLHEYDQIYVFPKHRAHLSQVRDLPPPQPTGAAVSRTQVGDSSIGLAKTMAASNAGNITAYWKGYREYKSDGISDSLPRMWGFQAEGAAPLVNGAPVRNPETIATAIRIGNPASWDFAIAARDESEGLIDSVTDAEILEAYRLLASTEGLFCEPSSAAGVAGMLKRHRAGQLDPGQTIVCTLTGNGLKDPHWALEGAADPVIIDVNADAAARALGLEA